MKSKLKLGIGAIAVSLLALTGCSAENGQTPGNGNTGEPQPTNVLQGKTIDVVVAYSPGGAYDRLARAIEADFERVTESTVVVQYEPGAGSLLATNKTFATPGSVHRLQLMNTIGVVAAQIAQETAEGVNYDLSEFEWIGSLTNEPEIYVVPEGSQFETIEGLKQAHANQTPIKFGSTGPGDNTWIAAMLMRDIFGFNIEIVSGFASAPEIHAAITRKEIDMAATSLASAMVPIDAGSATPVFYIGDNMSSFEGISDMIAEITDLADLAGILGVDEQRAANFIEPYSELTKINRSLVAPPGTDPAVVEAYRSAIEEVLSNQELIDAQAETGLYINLTGGADTQRIIDQALNASEDFKELLIRSFEQR